MSTATKEVEIVAATDEPEVSFTPEEQAAFAAGFEGKTTDPADVLKAADELLAG